jgi:hypothetical protein
MSVPPLPPTGPASSFPSAGPEAVPPVAPGSWRGGRGGLEADLLVDRRRLKRSRGLWRALAVIVVALGVGLATVGTSSGWHRGPIGAGIGGAGRGTSCG